MSISGSRTMKVAQYCLLPQVLPRITALLFSGFSYFAFFIAQIYRGARLLPEGHPYLNPAEIGHFSIADVLFAAGRNLKHRRENIDQIIIYYVIMLGLLLMGLQALFLIIGMFAPQAMAFSLADYFGDAHKLGVGVNPYQDLAFIMLDRVFGVPGIFESCVSEGQPCLMSNPQDTWDGARNIYTPAGFPWPFHYALQAMFMFYSIGLLIIGMMILLYFVIVIVAETAQTGVPFGKRFNKVWAPLRLVVALGLLIPVSYGLNTAQYIVLYAAKLGSNFATNGWIQFNSQLANGSMFSEEMIALPQTPNVGDVLQLMMLAHACKAVQEGILVQQNPEAADGGGDCPVDAGDRTNGSVIEAYLVTASGDANGDAVPLEDMEYAAAKAFFNNGDMTIRIGDRGCTADHNKQKGHVIPTCGEVMLPMPTQHDQTSGAYVIQEGYYGLIKHLWGGYGGKIWGQWGFCNAAIGGYDVHGVAASNYGAMVTPSAGDEQIRFRSLFYAGQRCPAKPRPDLDREPGLTNFPPTADWLQGLYNNYMYGNGVPFPARVASVGEPAVPANLITTNIVRAGVEAERQLVAAGKYTIPIDLLDRGWAGAGLWYNKVAAANGAITGAALAAPKVTKFPDLMEKVAAAKMRDLKNISGKDMFTPVKGSDSSLQFRKDGEEESANTMAQLYGAWRGVGSQYKPQSGNIIYDMINELFGTQGLFDLRDPGNINVHPLAQLTAMGKSLLEASIRNLAFVVGGELAEGLLSQTKMGGVVGLVSGVLSTVIGITFGAGIILYYVLPFMPFVYFFFAVGSWIKAVFEAMVGVPLWALAHIRIDGDGLPGQAALNGYFMIFEIFLRPIMTVFGLIAAVSIFAAMATVLNAIFDIAVVNVGGTNFNTGDTVSLMEFARGPIDQLFYTVMYAVIMYIIAMSSFKMIDLIPNQVMRWMGVSIQSFASMTGDSAQGIMSTMQNQGLGSVNQAVKGIEGAASAGGKAIGKVMET